MRIETRPVVRLFAAVTAAAAVLAACAAPERTSGVGDLLFVSTRAGVVALDGETGRKVLDAPYAASTPDWTQVFLADSTTDATHVVLHDLATSAKREVARVPGTLALRIVSRSGELVAMTEPRPVGTAAWNPIPRNRTELAVLHLSGRVRRFDLPGNFEPEAFTADDLTLILVEYVPPTRPDRYRLRELDLATGKVLPLGVRVKLRAPDEMRGTGRTQVPAPDGGALYTLYTRQGPNLAHASGGTASTQAPVHSFVHVLNLVQGFAHCVDLPHGFGAGPTAAALSPDGSPLFVVDAGRVVVVDTRSLRVSRTAPIRLADTSSMSAAAQGGSDGALFVGAGEEVVVLDQATLRLTGRYPVGREVSGLALSPDGRRLYVALEREVAVIDAATGVEIRSFHVPGITGIAAAVSAQQD